MIHLATALFAVAIAAPPQAAASTQAPEAEVAVEAALEELRKGELLLDADFLEPLVAHSLTVVEAGSRISGSFAFLETMRRLRQRKGEVHELQFEDVMVRAYGASAVASYRYHKVWVDGGARHREDGWCSDVFERRDDGAWILVHRHRSK